jgi:phasin
MRYCIAAFRHYIKGLKRSCLPFVANCDAETSGPALRASLPQCSTAKFIKKKEECVMAEKSVATQSKETFEKVSAATSEAAGAVQNSYSVGLKGIQDYNKRWLEFAQANTKTTMDFYQSMFAVKSPSEFIELSTEHAQKQLTTLTEQTKQLAELAQQVTLAAAEPLKTGFTKASGRI